jgi:hypothetical protein
MRKQEGDPRKSGRFFYAGVGFLVWNRPEAAGHGLLADRPFM